MTIEDDENTAEDGQDAQEGIVIIDELEDLIETPEKNKDTSKTRASLTMPKKINKKRLGIFNKDDKNGNSSKEQRTTMTVTKDRDLDEKTLKKQEEEVDSIFEQRTQRPKEDI